MTGGLQSSAGSTAQLGRGCSPRHRAVEARARLDHKPKAVEGVDSQEQQPKVEGDTGQGSEVDPLPAIWLFPRPVEQGRYECDEEDKGLNAQQDDDKFTVVLDVVTKAAGAVARHG